MEWFGYLTHSGRHPYAFSLLALATLGYVLIPRMSAGVSTR
jgi:hypothetical protein